VRALIGTPRGGIPAVDGGEGLRERDGGALFIKILLQMTFLGCPLCPQ